MAELTYYVDGEFVEADEARLPIGDLAILRGFGVFDYLRTYDHVPFMLKEHIERLQRSAQQIDLHLPWSLDEIASIVEETNDRNGLPNAGIRIIVSGGESHSFMLPEDKSALSVLIHPITKPAGSSLTEGASTVTTKMGRFMPTVKSLNYMGAIMAVREAAKTGAFEAVYRTADDTVTEGTRSNLFIIKDGRIITPKDDVLPGITRMAVLKAVDGKYEVELRAVGYDELLNADEVFHTSTTQGVIPVVKVDGNTIGNGRTGECTLDIAELFHAYVEEQTGAKLRA